MSEIDLAEKYYKDKQYDKAFEIWTHLDNHSALYSLGCCYYKGHGVDIDYKKAFEYYSKSFNKVNNLHAGETMIYMYRDNEIPFDMNEIMKIYYQLNMLDITNSEWSEIINLIATCYKENCDYTEEFSWYNKSYDLCKNINNTFNIAECHRYGTGTIVDHKKAMKYYNEYLLLDTHDRDRDHINVKSIIDSYEEHGTSNYENSIKYKIELTIILLHNTASGHNSSAVKIPKELGRIIGEYLYHGFFV